MIVGQSEQIDPHNVSIERVETKFKIFGSITVQVTRIKFPLYLAWALTIHKVQGLSVHEIVLDMIMEKGVYNHG